MITSLLETLASQATAYNVAATTTLNKDDEEGSSSINEFTSLFISCSAQPKLVTADELRKLAETIFLKEQLTDYVFGLRFFALAPFTGKEIAEIAESFAYANSNTSALENIRGKNVLPDDAERWKTTPPELTALYQANTWVLPLLALGMAFPEVVNETH